MEFIKSLAIAASGLRAQAGRVRMLPENAGSTGQSAGGDSYRRRIPPVRPAADRSLDGRMLGPGPAGTGQSSVRVRHEPDHRAVDGSGAVKSPSISPVIEMTALREERSDETNRKVIGATRRMIQRTLDMLRA